MDKNALLDCWTMFQREHEDVSVDRMVCDPTLRDAFVESAVSGVADATEEQILWVLMGLRKARHLPKKSGNLKPE